MDFSAPVAVNSYPLFLSDRYQSVNIWIVKHSWMALQKGSPQGASLCPSFICLYNIFMNNIFHFIELCDLANYADDTTPSIITSTINSGCSRFSKTRY